jgi:DNA-binding NarL/FixJ family response regulator
VTFRAVVVATTHLVRQLVGPCLTPLGGQLYEFSELEGLAPRINEIDPELIVLDIDGTGRQWRAAAATLNSIPRPAPLVLLAGRFGFDDAHEALALGVASVILKPYRREEHTERLYDLVLKRRGIRPRRSEPRLVPPHGQPLRAEWQDATGRNSAPVRDISSEGLGVAPEDALDKGAFVPAVEVSVRGENVGFSARVVDRARGRAGLRVIAWTQGRPRWIRLLEELHTRAFGEGRARRKW